MEYLKELIEKGGPEEPEFQVLTETVKNMSLHPEIDKLKASIVKNFDCIFSENSMLGFSFQKPHGYAGDFEIIDRIYTKWTSTDPQLQKWDAYFHSLHAPKAVRNRKDYFINLVNSLSENHNETFSVLNVASGPGRDMYEYFTQTKKKHVQFTCIEYDANAINYASKLCMPFMEKIIFHRANALKFKLDETFDLVWSAGLFDYFDDSQFVYLLKKFASMTRKNGTIVIGNFNENNPTRPYMEVFGDWILNHRSEDDLKNLCLEAGFTSDHIDVFSEDTGVNLFLHIRVS